MRAGGPAVKSKIPTVPFGRLPSQVDKSNKSATTMATCSPKDPCTAAVPSVVLSVAAVVVVVVVVIGADEDVAAVVAAVVASVVAVRKTVLKIIILIRDQTCGGTNCGTSCGASFCLEVGGHCQDHTTADHLAHRYAIFLCPPDVDIEIIIIYSQWSVERLSTWIITYRSPAGKC